MAETTIYVKDGCPYCSRLKDELDSKGKKYELRNVSRDPVALKDVKKKYGADRVPVLVEGENVTIGYNGQG